MTRGVKNSSFSFCCNDISISTQCDMNVEQGKFSDGDFQGGIRVDDPEDFP